MCLSGLTQQALLRGELDVAQAHNRDALCLARAQGSLVFEGLMELDHAQWLEQRGAPARAESLLFNIHELLCQQADRPAPLLGRIALRRGRLALTMGQDEYARECFQRGLELCLHSHDKRVLYGFLGLAQLAANQGDYTQAFIQLRDAERLMQQRQIPDTVYRGVLLQVSSQFWLQQGRPQLAHEALTRVLRHYCGPQARQAPPATLELVPRIECLLILAEVYLQQLSNAAALLQTLIDNAHANGMYALEAELHLARAEVIWLQGESHLATAALQEGEQMISRCQGRQAWRELQLRQPQWLLTSAAQVSITELSVEAHSSSPLSKRELEVLQLIAQGNSNQQIADVLFISLHTVKTHARRINGKLGVERRTQAVAKAKLLGVCA
jgi:ATP/maltotriose-dependent transcriptional regulator MalT